MTPMRILQGKPTISGQDIEERQDEEQGKDAEQGEDTGRVKRVLPLVIGSKTYVTEEVEVTPGLDILIATSQPLTTGRKNQRPACTDELPGVALVTGWLSQRL